MGFYAYLWLREDGTPYYAGKGTGKRAFVRRENHWPPANQNRVHIFARATEDEAFATEKELIANWGRKDIGTGCLRNYTDGGDGVSGLRVRRVWNKGVPMSEESKIRLSRSKKGQWHPQSEETRKRIGLAHRGKIATAETRNKQSLAKQGKPSNWSGKTASAETRLKQSLAKKGKPWTAAQRAAREKKICLT